MRSRYTKGSAALMSILIVAAICILVVLGTSEVTLNTLYQSADNYSMYNSDYMAQGCLEEALIRLEADTSFSSETLTFDAQSNCVISVTGINPYNVNIVANYLSASQSYLGSVQVNAIGNVNNAQLLEWKEI